MFRITGGKGFHITFENGITVSVQFGIGNYCQHHHDSFDLIGKERHMSAWESSDAEIAIFRVDVEGWLTPKFDPAEGQDVLGWVSPAKVLDALNWAAAYKDGEN